MCADLASLSDRIEIISVCLINDYSLIADLHIFVFMDALNYLPFHSNDQCTKVKLLILNNFGQFNPLNVDNSQDNSTCPIPVNENMSTCTPPMNGGTQQRRHTITCHHPISPMSRRTESKFTILCSSHF